MLFPGNDGIVVAGCQETHRSQLLQRGGQELAQSPTGTGLRLQEVSEDVQLTENPEQPETQEQQILCGLFSTRSTLMVKLNDHVVSL